MCCRALLGFFTADHCFCLAAGASVSARYIPVCAFFSFAISVFLSYSMCQYISDSLSTGYLPLPGSFLFHCVRRLLSFPCAICQQFMHRLQVFSSVQFEALPMLIATSNFITQHARTASGRHDGCSGIEICNTCSKGCMLFHIIGNFRQ